MRDETLPLPETQSTDRKAEVLGPFEMKLIRVVLSLQGNVAGAYGVTIQQFFKQHQQAVPPLSMIYSSLARLHSRGLVDWTATASSPVRGGRSTKVYHVN